jgi:SNF2 family DNA or RNA helicase
MRNTWGIEDGQICIRSENGGISYPAARELFKAIFLTGSDSALPPDLPNVVVSLPQLSFSRFSPAPALLFAGSLDGTITLQIGCCVSDQFIPLGAGQDQVIALNKWFAVDTAETTEVDRWLSSRGVDVSKPISYGKVLALKKDALGFVSVIDRIVTDPRALKAATGGTEVCGLNVKLYPYQIAGVAFLQAIAKHGLGCILADEMGLGKTLQLIALLLSERNLGNTPSLVIAPATLLENWRREIANFAPVLKVLLHTGPLRTGDPNSFLNVDVVITSYDTAVRDEVLLSAISWNVLVLDEAQHIKNASINRSMALGRLDRRVSVAVTGTPVENHLSDLLALIDFALNGLFAYQPALGGKVDDTTANAEKVAELAAPIILRRTVSEVAADLPPRIDILQPIVMSEQLQVSYEQLRKEILTVYGPSGALVATTRLRVLCTDQVETDPANSQFALSPAKLYRLFEILEKIFDLSEKALIFTSFQSTTDSLLARLSQRWPKSLFHYLDGRVSVDERQPMVDHFSSFDGPGAMILNPRAAGTGLNITAANHVIHYNPEWNPALTAQSTARAFRRKQTLPVTVHHLFYVGSVEEVIVSRAAFKRQLAGDVFDHYDECVENASLNALALSASPISEEH